MSAGPTQCGGTRTDGVHHVRKFLHRLLPDRHVVHVGYGSGRLVEMVNVQMHFFGLSPCVDGGSSLYYNVHSSLIGR